MIYEKKLDYSDINLIPRIISTLKSRNEADTSVKFGDITLQLPIIASPMRDVCDGKVAQKMNELGGLGIIHRFLTIDDQVQEFKSVKLLCGCAIGINGDSLDRFHALYDNGCRLYCIDVANGGSQNVLEFIESLDKSDIQLMVGNVASKECFGWLENLPNVQFIRNSVAGGAACSTKNATGIYHPLASCVSECARIKRRNTLIADGGIKEPQDFCKAMALGADGIMLGRAIATTSDSPAEEMSKDNKLYKVYHGSASFEIQQTYRDKPRYIEGRTLLLEYTSESLESLIQRYRDGLQSCMSYFNARNIKEFQQNVTFQ